MSHKIAKQATLNIPQTGHWAYLNGEYTPLSEAKISVLDRGFLFGEGAYEVIPAYYGKLRHVKQHLARLQASLNHIDLKLSLEVDKYETILSELINRNGKHHQYLYIQITRGMTPYRNHLFPKESVPTLLIFSQELQLAKQETLAKGIQAVTMDDIRWQHCHIKATSLLANVLLKQQAQQQDAFEAILISNGHAVEGAASNIFIVKNNEIITPPLTPNILSGITRSITLELAEQLGIACQQRVIKQEELLQADEIWLTNSTGSIMPVTTLNKKAVGTGIAGAIWHKLYTLYEKQFIEHEQHTEISA